MVSKQLQDRMDSLREVMEIKNQLRKYLKKGCIKPNDEKTFVENYGVIAIGILMDYNDGNDGSGPSIGALRGLVAAYNAGMKRNSKGGHYNAPNLSELRLCAALGASGDDLGDVLDTVVERISKEKLANGDARAIAAKYGIELYTETEVKQ